MNDADYYSDNVGAPVPTLSVSTAKFLPDRPSLAYRYHPRLGGQEFPETAAMIRGRAIHSLILGGSEVVTIDADDYRTRAAQEARDAALAEGNIPATRPQAAEWRKVAEVAREVLDREAPDRETEVPIVYQSGGVWCRSKLDAVTTDGLVIWDVKTVGSLPTTTHAAFRLADDGMWALQQEAYLDGWQTLHPDLAGRVTFKFLVIADDAESIDDTRIVTLDGSMAFIGRSQWARARQLWRACLESNQWSDPRVLTVSAPAWRIAEEDAHHEDV